MKLIGLSLSQCVRDIADGLVCEKVVAQSTGNPEGIERRFGTVGLHKTKPCATSRSCYPNRPRQEFG